MHDDDHDQDHPSGTRPAPADPLGRLRFHHLLVAVDGSESSELALSAAIVAAERDHARLTLISVAPTTSQWASATAPAAYDPSMQEQMDRCTAQILRDAVERIPPEIPVTTLFRRGRPGPEIVAAAEAGDYDAILLGARGVGRIRALIGSVSHHVLRHASVTVFVAHAPRAAETETEAEGNAEPEGD